MLKGGDGSECNTPSSVFWLRQHESFHKSLAQHERLGVKRYFSNAKGEKAMGQLSECSLIQAGAHNSERHVNPSTTKPRTRLHGQGEVQLITRSRWTRERKKTKKGRRGGRGLFVGFVVCCLGWFFHKSFPGGSPRGDWAKSFGRRKLSLTPRERQLMAPVRLGRSQNQKKTNKPRWFNSSIECN